MSLLRTFHLISLPEATDERGHLVYAEGADLPFPVERVFWIYGVPEGRTRGGHAHGTQAEVIFPVKGSFDIFVDDGRQQRKLHMDSPREGVYIGPEVWCELQNFSADCVCMVLCSQPYDRDGYINRYSDFQKRTMP